MNRETLKMSIVRGLRASQGQPDEKRAEAAVEEVVYAMQLELSIAGSRPLETMKAPPPQQAVAPDNNPAPGGQKSSGIVLPTADDVNRIGMGQKVDEINRQVEKQEKPEEWDKGLDPGQRASALSQQLSMIVKKLKGVLPVQLEVVPYGVDKPITLERKLEQNLALETVRVTYHPTGQEDLRASSGQGSYTDAQGRGVENASVPMGAVVSEVFSPGDPIRPDDIEQRVRESAKEIFRKRPTSLQPVPPPPQRPFDTDDLKGDLATGNAGHIK